MRIERSRGFTFEGVRMHQQHGLGMGIGCHLPSQGFPDATPFGGEALPCHLSHRGQGFDPDTRTRYRTPT